MKKNRLGKLLFVAGLALAGCSSQATEPFEKPFEGRLAHVHGIGYAGNDDGLYFASHSGLKIYRNGDWFETKENFHDYMGFNAVDEGFFASGHPSADSDLPNPLGIQRSDDGGESLEEVAFLGETDFHAMAVGFNSHDIFLLNPGKNTLLDAGFYKSTDEGESWQHAKAAGLEGEVSALALHPTDSTLVAAATSTGIYLSKDAGENFQPVSGKSESGTAVFFTEDHFYFASYGTEPSLKKYTIKTQEEENLNLPEMKQDGVAFLAQNPKNPEELALYSIQGKAYLTQDGAEKWEDIAD